MRFDSTTFCWVEDRVEEPGPSVSCFEPKLPCTVLLTKTCPAVAEIVVKHFHRLQSKWLKSTSNLLLLVLYGN